MMEIKFLKAFILCLFAQVSIAATPSEVLLLVNDWYEAHPIDESFVKMTGESNGFHLSSEASIVRSGRNWVVQTTYLDPTPFELIHYWRAGSEVYVHFPIQEITCIDEDPMMVPIFGETSFLQSRTEEGLRSIGYELQSEVFEDTTILSLRRNGDVVERLDFHVSHLGEIHRIEMAIGQDEFNFEITRKPVDAKKAKQDLELILKESKNRVAKELEKIRDLEVSSEVDYAELLESEIIISFQKKVLGL